MGAKTLGLKVQGETVERPTYVEDDFDLKYSKSNPKKKILIGDAEDFPEIRPEGFPQKIAVRIRLINNNSLTRGTIFNFSHIKRDTAVYKWEEKHGNKIIEHLVRFRKFHDQKVN